MAAQVQIKNNNNNNNDTKQNTVIPSEVFSEFPQYVIILCPSKGKCLNVNALGSEILHVPPRAWDDVILHLRLIVNR